MVTWSSYVYFALPAMLLLFIGAAAAWRRSARVAMAFTAGAILVSAAFIAAFWVGLQRPPMRTIGETRLWYSFFMMVSGFLVYTRWKYRWILFFSAVMAAVFASMNIFMPEIHDRTLVPALQSGWFVPHVTVYMFSYSVFGCAVILAAAGLIRRTDTYLPSADSLVYIGTTFLTLGMLSGALWAKEAWGLYWNWDPKETWAAVTWILCLIYMHCRLGGRGEGRLASLLLILIFIGLQMCWYGVNWLPSAQESMHVY